MPTHTTIRCSNPVSSGNMGYLIPQPIKSGMHIGRNLIDETGPRKVRKHIKSAWASDSHLQMNLFLFQFHHSLNLNQCHKWPPREFLTTSSLKRNIFRSDLALHAISIWQLEVQFRGRKFYLGGFWRIMEPENLPLAKLLNGISFIIGLRWTEIKIYSYHRQLLMIHVDEKEQDQRMNNKTLVKIYGSFKTGFRV